MGISVGKSMGKSVEKLVKKSVEKSVFEVLVPSPFQKYSLCATLTEAVFVYLYLGNEGVVGGELVVDLISIQKIFGLGGLKCHIMEI